MTIERKKKMTQVICKAIRPTTESTITVTIPADIGTDPYACTQWLGEEFDWQFIPMSYETEADDH